MPRIETGNPWIAVYCLFRIIRALCRMEKLLLQKDKIFGNLHRLGSEISEEGTLLEGGEEIVQLLEMLSHLCLLLLHRGHDLRKALLQVEGGDRDFKCTNLLSY